MIVKGYKGIMDLDLSLVDPKFHKEAIMQHRKDIKEYKLEQQNLPQKLRYENATWKALNMIELDRNSLKQRRIEADEIQRQKDKEKEEIMLRVQEIKKTIKIINTNSVMW